MALNLTKESKFTRVANSAVAGVTDITTSVIDMAGYDGATFVASLGDVLVNSVLSLKIQQSDVGDGTGMVDAVGLATAAHTATGTDADNRLLIAEIVRPRKRYIRAVLSRTVASAVVDGIVCLQTGPHESPTTQDTTVLASAFGLSPA